MARTVTLPMRGIRTLPSDGRTGICVGVHWTAWIAYFCVAPLVTVGAYYGVLWAWGIDLRLGLAALVLAILGLGKVLVLWALDKLQRCILVTEGHVYDRRRQVLFFTTTTAIPVTDSGRFDHRINGRIGTDGSITDGRPWALAALLGIRSCGYITEGDDPECFLPASDMTQDDMDRITALTALST